MPRRCMKDPQTYEHVLPESVGNHRKVLVSDQAGRSNVMAELDRAGIALREERSEAGAAGRGIEGAGSGGLRL